MKSVAKIFAKTNFSAFFHPLSRRMHIIFVLMIGCFCMAYTRLVFNQILILLSFSEAILEWQSLAWLTAVQPPSHFSKNSRGQVKRYWHWNARLYVAQMPN
jgi:hypothetical protein